MSGYLRIIQFAVVSLIGLLPGLALASEGGHGGPELGNFLPMWSVIPFVGILLCIAVLPLVAEHWWESNKNKAIVSAICGVPMLAYLLLVHLEHGATTSLVHSLHEYYSFIILLASLFTISGGIFLEGDLRATPATNTAFLAIGGLLASFIGTTGAAMLLIRPLLMTNAERHKVVHIFVFFIFIVANIGGSLLPIGDPPLFLGFLRGVPFFWTFGLVAEWATAIGILLVIFYIWDTIAFKKETKADKLRDKVMQIPLRVRGMSNFLLLGGVVASVIFLKDDLQWFREPTMILLAVISFFKDRMAKKKDPQVATPREKNKFTFHAIIEVAVLFIGIFICMIPALALLRANGAALGINQPWQYYWMTGALSSFLDNAPTYLTFFTLAQANADCAAHAAQCVPIASGGIETMVLVAISLGAVFMGANTYIGNGPNFMVKAIVDESGVKMPSFFGYMAYSMLILIPVFILITFLFPLLH